MSCRLVTKAPGVQRDSVLVKRVEVSRKGFKLKLTWQVALELAMAGTQSSLQWLVIVIHPPRAKQKPSDL